MTAEEKKSVAFFIDLASDMERGGYFRGEREYCWEDPVPNETAPSPSGVINPLVMVIGEISDSGEETLLLDKMLGSIGLSRESNCIIVNINREPQPDEIAAGFLESQIQSLKPRFILCLGEFPSQVLLHSAEPIGKLRGKFMDCKTAGMTMPLIATYHPNDLLRNGEYKRPAWDDLKLLRAAIGPVESGAK